MNSANDRFLVCFSGVNLYAMLTGRLPYTVEPFNITTLYNKMLKRQMNATPEYLSEGRIHLATQMTSKLSCKA